MGGRSVVVEGGDLCGIALGDYAPAQFQRGCQLTGIHRPFVGNQVEALDGLEIRQALINAVDEGMVLRLHRWIRDQIRARGEGDSLLPRQVLERWKVRRDQRAYKLV